MRLSVFALMVTIPCFAATITTNQCASGPQIACSASASITGFGTNSIAATASASVVPYFGIGSGYANAAVSATGVTAGPVRSGVVVFYSYFLNDVAAVAGQGSASLTLGITSCSGFDPFDCHLRPPGGHESGNDYWAPFTLGVPFAIAASAGTIYGEADARLRFSIFEQLFDGLVIPGAPAIVQDANVPEPTPAGILGIGLLTMFAVRRRRAGKSRI